MSYDNSELLRNYLHGWQVTQNHFYAKLPKASLRGLIRFCLIRSMADFTPARTPTTPSTTTAITSPGRSLNALCPVRQEARVMELYYDVEAHGEMHHNPAKNVLWIAHEPADIAEQLVLTEPAVRAIIVTAKAKCLPHVCCVRRPSSTKRCTFPGTLCSYRHISMPLGCWTAW